MREAHQLDEKNAVVSVSGRPGSSGTYNHEMGHTQGEDLASSQVGNRRSRRNKRNARHQGVEIHPDQDESYVGNVSNIDDLVKYINNDISAENLKEIDGNLKGSDGTSSPAVSVPAINVKLSKKKERNRLKASETKGAVETSDTVWTQSSGEQLAVKQTESREPVGSLDDKDRREMGNSSSADKLDTNEDGAQSSSSKLPVVEPETNNKKMPKNEITKTNSKKATKSEVVRSEAGKNLKNHVIINNKTTSNTKPGKNSDDKTKAKLRENGRDTDAEGTKLKNSKKAKSKSVKDSQKELEKRIHSPSPPATPEIPVDGSGGPQEQWCTVVSKPQKKKRSQTQTSALTQNCYNSVNNHQTHSKDLQPSPSPYPFDPHRKGQQNNTAHLPSSKPVSFTPPYLKASETEKREKDLNPSDFPVLNSSPRDHRRSLENVFDTGALISDKDSDKESSKSFPADMALVSSLNRTSYPVSYASMASSNTVHESLDSSKTETSERVNSCVEDSRTEFSANSASLNWKGSPRERRHSIGSAPKELSKNVLQRTGSQEMLSSDKDLRSETMTIPTKTNSANCKNLVSSDSAGSFTNSDADSTRGSEVGSEGIDDEFTATLSVSTTNNPGTFGETKKIAVHAEEIVSSVNTESELMKAKSIPVEPVLRSQAVRSETRINSSGAKQTNNGRKKGVVFFCNKNEMSTPITGLHFGFFHDEEYSSVVTDSALNKPSVPTSGEDVSQSVPEDNVCSTRSSLSSSSQLPAATTAVSSTSSDHVTKPPKGPHIAGLNGFISPQTLDTSNLVLQTSASPSVTLEQTPVQLESVVSAPICSVSASKVCPEASESKSKPVKELEDRVIFTYGSKLQNKEPKYAVYLRPPEEIAAGEPSQDLVMSINYLGGNWKWNNHQWEIV